MFQLCQGVSRRFSCSVFWYLIALPTLVVGQVEQGTGDKNRKELDTLRVRDVSFYYDGGSIVFELSDGGTLQLITVVHPNSLLLEKLGFTDQGAPLVLTSQSEKLSDATRLKQEEITALTDSIGVAAESLTKMESGTIAFLKLIFSNRPQIYWGRQATDLIKSGQGAECFADNTVGHVSVDLTFARVESDRESTTTWIAGLIKRALAYSEDDVNATMVIEVTQNRTILAPGEFLMVIGVRGASIIIRDVEGGEAAARMFEDSLKDVDGRKILRVGVYTNIPVHNSERPREIDVEPHLDTTNEVPSK